MSGTLKRAPVGDGIALIVLAAGAGTRMKSSLPKPLHPVAGAPMLWHVLKAGGAVEPAIRIAVLNPSIAEDPAWVSAGIDVESVIQDPPRGTADAVICAIQKAGDPKWLLVLFADHPLLTGETVQRLVAKADESRARVTILTCELDDGASYARIERDDLGQITRVVERKDDDPARRTGPFEINSGMMIIDAAWGKEALARIEPSLITGELYLPELVKIAVDEWREGEPWPVDAVRGEIDDLLGVNDRIEQAEADARLRDRIRRQHMLSGVTMILPETISIDEGVEIGPDTTILPFTVIERGSRIGARCRIGPHAFISGATIADDVVIRSSTVVDSSMEQGSDAGPYAHLRGGTQIGSGAHIGNYAELKSAQVGENVRIGHVSYIGDATIGAETNIGAGSITCNYDGIDKHKTEIGESVFVGSDTMLVAPVRLGDGARTGAGSVVTKDVPAGATVVGVPARRIESRRTSSKPAAPVQSNPESEA